jgi:predicted amidohydrolase YtcJ
LTFEENIKGRLTSGMLADMVMLDRDIMTVSDAELVDTRVLGTIVGGKVVFGNETLTCGR